MNIGELFLKIGIKADTQAVSRINAGFKDMRGILTEIQIAFAAAVYGLDKFISGTVNGVAALQNLNQQTGLSIDLIQKWQQAGQLSNLALTADAIANSIGNLQKNLSAIKLGQGNVSPFQLLGIDVNNKDAFGVLDELRDRVKGLEPGIASNLIQQLGLDPAMISVLKLTNEQFEKLSKNSFLGKGGRAAVLAAGFAVKEVKLRLEQLKDLVVAKLAPALSRILNDFFKWIAKNQGQIIGAITSIVNAIKSFVSAFGNAIDLAARFIDGVTGMQNGIKILAGAFAFLTLSFRPVLFGLFAIIALLDDIRVWQLGGKSLFGDFYSAMARISKELKPIKDLFVGFKDAISEAFGFDDKTENKIEKLSGLLQNIKEVGASAGFGAILGFLKGGIGGAIKGAALFAGGDILGQFIEYQKSIYDQGKVSHGNLAPKVMNQINNFNIHSSNADGNTIGSGAYKEAVKQQDLMDTNDSIGNGGI